MPEKSEVRANLSARMYSRESPNLTVETAPENVLNTACPGRLPSWILPTELMTLMRPTTRGVQSPAGPPVAYKVPAQSDSSIVLHQTFQFHLLNGEIEINAMTEFENCFNAQWDQEESMETTLKEKPLRFDQ